MKIDYLYIAFLFFFIICLSSALFIPSFKIYMFTDWTKPEMTILIYVLINGLFIELNTTDRE